MDNGASIFDSYEMLYAQGAFMVGDSLRGRNCLFIAISCEPASTFNDPALGVDIIRKCSTTDKINYYNTSCVKTRHIGKFSTYSYLVRRL
jgi:hypothetical protein